MLHLAQVQTTGALGKPELLLLAYQKSATTWALLPKVMAIPAPETETWGEGALVLVEVEDDQASNLHSATDWVLDLIKTYLLTGITPEFLKAEGDRAEEWRQNLTLQSQELARKGLEVESRREQIQGLEENLRQLEEKLKQWEQELKDKEASLG